MTPQEIFDTVVRHLAKQGRPARTEAICAYRMDMGDGTVLQCAVGCLIPEHLYSLDMEGLRVQNIVLRPTLPEWFRVNSSLLADLQGDHDGWLEGAPFSAIAPDLAATAEVHNLSTDVIREVSQ